MHGFIPPDLSAQPFSNNRNFFSPNIQQTALLHNNAAAMMEFLRFSAVIIFSLIFVPKLTA